MWPGWDAMLRKVSVCAQNCTVRAKAEANIGLIVAVCRRQVYGAQRLLVQHHRESAREALRQLRGDRSGGGGRAWQ